MILLVIISIFLLILNQINEIEQVMNVDLIGANQHGFKKGRSTLTSRLSIQSALAKALDQEEFVLMASLDLSSAFNVVDINLIIISRLIHSKIFVKKHFNLT